MRTIRNQKLFFLLFFSNCFLFAQTNIAKGFEFLEEGNFEKAESFFQEYLKNDATNKTAKLCYGRAVGLNGNPTKAKVIFDELLLNNPNNVEFKINASEALLWLKEYDLALKEYTKLYNSDPENVIVLLGLANTHSNLKNFKKSINLYKKVIEKSEITGAYIGLAYTYHANDQDDKSLEIIEKVLDKFPNNKELKALKSKIESKYKPSFSSKYSTTLDNGENSNKHTNVTVSYPIKTKHKIEVSYSYSDFMNKKSFLSAQQNTIGVEYGIKLKRGVRVFSKAMFLKSKSENNYTGVNYNFRAELKPMYNQTFNFIVENRYQDFNVDLVNNKIQQNNISFNYNLFTKYRIGVFSQYTYTKQSDDNKRNLFYNSVYYKFKGTKELKIGANVSYMGFLNDENAVYFSPQKYWLSELFAETSLVTFNKFIKLNFNGAYGYQFINESTKQDSYRVEAKILFTIKKWLKLSAFGNYSNIASSNEAGFNFTSFGINALYGF